MEETIWLSHGFVGKRFFGHPSARKFSRRSAGPARGKKGVLAPSYAGGAMPRAAHRIPSRCRIDRPFDAEATEKAGKVPRTNQLYATPGVVPTIVMQRAWDVPQPPPPPPPPDDPPLYDVVIVVGRFGQAKIEATDLLTGVPMLKFSAPTRL